MLQYSVDCFIFMSTNYLRKFFWSCQCSNLWWLGGIEDCLVLTSLFIDMNIQPSQQATRTFVKVFTLKFNRIGLEFETLKGNDLQSTILDLSSIISILNSDPLCFLLVLNWKLQSLCQSKDNTTPN